MEIKKLINIAMIEEVTLSYDPIRAKHIVNIRMASGAEADISFTDKDSAENEYNRLKDTFANIEITN